MRYPTIEGLAVHPESIGLTVVEHKGKGINRHHRYWPANQYQGSISRVFRGLVTHVHPMYIQDHEELHQDFSPPIQPQVGLMIDVLDEYLSMQGIIDVVREHKTCEQYQITAQQWARMRNK